jgi:hypothetical protein
LSEIKVVDAIVVRREIKGNSRTAMEQIQDKINELEENK